jgi:hypothetical protein
MLEILSAWVKKKLNEYQEKALEEAIKWQIFLQKQKREESVKKTWEDFYSKNQDLVASKEIVDYVMQKNWQELGYLPIDRSLPLLAEKTRQMLGFY